MPTARELLEQADALMRRNRTAAADDIPVLTEAVSPTPALRVPLRPSPESAPVTMADDATADAAPEVIPTLTEKVPPGAPGRDGAVLAEGEPSDWLDFDAGEPSITGQAPDSVMSVPEVVTADDLREASDADVDAGAPVIAEEIELAPAADADFEAEMGGASAAAGRDDVPGLQPAGTDVTAEGREDAVPSDAGTADAAAPPVEAARDEPVRARAAWLETELPPEIEALPALAAEAELVFDSPSSVSWNVEAVLAGSAPEAAAQLPSVAASDAIPPGRDEPDADELAPDEPTTAFAAPPATEADEPVLIAAPAAIPDGPVLSPAAARDEVSLVPSPAEAFAAVPQPSFAVDAGGEDEDPRQLDEPRGDALDEDTAIPPTAVAWESPFATLPAAPEAPAVAPPPAVAAPVVTAAADDARWAAMAEEIRMQVLQRIDLFTDAGLRDQLGERLQPIVDRASADLVRTINQHVGELLRAYVAEAIEREIERWRTSQQ